MNVHKTQFCIGLVQGHVDRSTVSHRVYCMHFPRRWPCRQLTLAFFDLFFQGFDFCFFPFSLAGNWSTGGLFNMRSRDIRSNLLPRERSLTSISTRKSTIRVVSYNGLYALSLSKIRKNVAPAMVKPSQSSGFQFLVAITGTIGFRSRRTSSKAARHIALCSSCGDRIGTNTEQRPTLQVALAFERFSKATLTPLLTRSS